MIVQTRSLVWRTRQDHQHAVPQHLALWTVAMPRLLVTAQCSAIQGNARGRGLDDKDCGIGIVLLILPTAPYSCIHIPDRIIQAHPRINRKHNIIPTYRRNTVTSLAAAPVRPRRAEIYRYISVIYRWTKAGIVELFANLLWTLCIEASLSRTLMNSSCPREHHLRVFGGYMCSLACYSFFIFLPVHNSYPTWAEQ